MPPSGAAGRGGRAAQGGGLASLLQQRRGLPVPNVQRHIVFGIVLLHMQQWRLGRHLREYFVTCLPPCLRRRTCVFGVWGGVRTLALAVGCESTVCTLLCSEFI